MRTSKSMAPKHYTAFLTQIWFITRAKTQLLTVLHALARVWTSVSLLLLAHDVPTSWTRQMEHIQDQSGPERVGFLIKHQRKTTHRKPPNPRHRKTLRCQESPHHNHPKILSLHMVKSTTKIIYTLILHGWELIRRHLTIQLPTHQDNNTLYETVLQREP